MSPPPRDAIAPSPLFAAIDIGTNTLLALVGRVARDGAIERVADTAVITRLGEGVAHTRRLRPAAMARALAALDAATAEARRLGAVRIAAVATSAVRDAENREQFLAAAREITGGEVAAISGAREAELTFAGAHDGTGLASGAEALVFDVGGGSTEVISGPLGATPLTRASVDLGSVRLTETELTTDPPTPEQIARVVARIDAMLASLGPPPAHAVLLGLAGTVTTLAAIDRAAGALDAMHGVHLARDRVEALSAQLAAMPVATRRTLPGLHPGRADVIVAGALIVAGVMRWAGSEALMVSDGGVRVGLLKELGRTQPARLHFPQ